MHRLLRSQLRRLDLGETAPTSEQWSLFLDRISETYAQNDQERYLRERGQTLAENELVELARNLERTRDEALAAAHTKSEFLANMSHEIRTPLNGILGLAQLMATTRLSDDQLEYCHGIESSGRALLTVINDILDFSKLEAGRVELENLPLDLPALLDEVGEILGGMARKKDLTLVLMTHSDVPRYVSGDVGRLRQILLNLTGNAIKFTPHGEVLVEAQAVGPGWIELRVADTGVGIPVDRIDGLFQAFQQGDASTTRRFGGTGLGLAITKGLVQRMGGSIGVESVEGEGATFTVRLPLEKTDPIEASEPEGHRFRGMHALVTDPLALNRILIRGVLEGWGVRVSTVEEDTPLRTAYEAMSTVDLVVADDESLAAACEGRHRLDAPTIVCTSSASVVQVGSTHDARVLKPIKREAMRRALQTVLTEGRQPDLDVRGPTEIRPTGVRVLLVEDNPVNQMVAIRMLEGAGHLVVLAQNGQEALDVSGQQSFDVILMDCQMPVMDGYQATQEIRRREGEGRRTPIIALTANAMEQDRKRSRAAQMDAHLAKPIRKEDLLSAIDRYTRPVPDEALTEIRRGA